MTSDASSQLFEVAKRLMPGGVSSPVRAISPYPFYVSRAEGPHLWTKEGQRLIDYCLAYGPMILGQMHALVMERRVTGEQRLLCTPAPSRAVATHRGCDRATAQND